MWYFKVQILFYKNKQDLKKQTSDLWRYCKFFDLPMVGSGVYGDSFYITLPKDPPEACLIINALNAYFYFHDIASRMNYDDSDGPLIDRVSEIDEVFVMGEWSHNTKNG